MKSAMTDLVMNDEGDDVTAALLEQPPKIELKKTSGVATFFIFLKSYLGSGIMGMASAFLSGGVIPTVLMIFFIAVLSCFCFILLFRVRDHLLRENPSISRQELHFERVMEEVLGKKGKAATIGALIFTQMGFATAYVIFIAKNLSKVYSDITFVEFCALQIVPLILLCWIRELKYITPVALAGMLSIALASGVVLYFCFVDSLIPNGVPEGALLRSPWATFPIAFGVNVYLFEGIGLILPLESKMEKPASFPAIMWGVHLFVATIVSAFGLIGYLAFYNCTAAPIIGNLPSSGAISLATIWSLNVCLLFTYPIQMVPVFQIMEDFFLVPSLEGTSADCCGKRAPLLEAHPYSCSALRPKGKFFIKSMIMRAAVVLISVGVAMSIPYFDLFLSLIGGLGSAQLMFILPPISYLVCFWKSPLLLGRWMKVACFAMLVFGIGTLVVTSVFTIIQIVEAFKASAIAPVNATICNVNYFGNFTQ